MAIRQILVPLVGTSDAERLLENAFKLASRLKAHVTVCDTVPRDLPYLDPTGMVAPDTYRELVEKLQGEQDHMRSAAHAKFLSAAKHFSIAISPTGLNGQASARWVDSKDYGRIVWSLGRLSDLVIARRPPGAGIADQEIIEEALFNARRPVLLVPPKATHLEDGVAVAWNGSIEAATALERAVDLLEPTQPVTLIQVGDLRPGALDAKDAVAYLESYGFTVHTRFPTDAPRGTADVILQAATDAKAGLIVAGAYTHSRIREELMGGVTATLLKKAHIPVFLAH